ncbi:MAG: hypothetical protein AAF208_13140 [Cyanobacteria bacterium P01_A01_bin.45]
MFNPSILELESQIQYHQEQQELAEQELDRLKMTQAFAEDAAEKVEDALEHIEPKYIDVFKEHLLALFPTEAPVYLEEKAEENIEVIDSTAVAETKPQKEFGPLSYYELTGKPDTRPDTYEDLAPNITYSSSGRAYVGFHDREEAEEFRDSISEPSMLSDTETMNGYKYEVKFYCNRGYIKELQQELENDWTPEQKAELDWQEQLVRIAPDIFYDPSEEVCYLGFKAKGRADNYGSYLTRILDIAQKYVVVNKPRITTNTKYELKLETIAEEDAKHLSKFNLKKEYDDSKNKDARELWRTTRKRVHPPACKPLDKLVPLAEIKLGDIVYLNSIDNQYKVLQKVTLDGIEHLEVICIYNSERPILVGATSYLKECYRVSPDNIQIDDNFQAPRTSSETVQKDTTQEKHNEEFPPGPYSSIDIADIEPADIVTTSPNSRSAYEVIKVTRDYVDATCLYNIALPKRIGETFTFSEIYLVERADQAKYSNIAA